MRKVNETATTFQGISIVFENCEAISIDREFIKALQIYHTEDDSALDAFLAIDRGGLSPQEEDRIVGWKNITHIEFYNPNGDIYRSFEVDYCTPDGDTYDIFNQENIYERLMIGDNYVQIAISDHLENVSSLLLRDDEVEVK